MARVLVTGGSGLIGWRVTEQLVEAGHDVVVYDLRPNEDNLATFRDRIEVVRGDVADLSQLLRAAKQNDIDRIAHLAAFINEESAGRPVDSFKINVLGTANVFDVALALDMKRVAWTSSVLATQIDDNYDFEPVDETYRMAPRTPYGVAKFACENLAAQYHELGLDTIGVRPPLSYGLGRIDRGGTGRFNFTVREAALGRTTAFLYPPDALYQPIYNRDMAAFIIAALFVEKTEHILFNTPVLQTYTGAGLVEVLQSLCPDAQVSAGPPNPGSPRSPVMDGSRAREEIGFTPSITLEQGFGEMVKYFRETA